MLTKLRVNETFAGVPNVSYIVDYELKNIFIFLGKGNKSLLTHDDAKSVITGIILMENFWENELSIRDFNCYDLGEHKFPFEMITENNVITATQIVLKPKESDSLRDDIQVGFFLKNQKAKLSDEVAIILKEYFAND